MINVAVPRARESRIQTFLMSFIDGESAYAELARASKAFSPEQIEDWHGSQPFPESLSSSGTIDGELRGAGGAFAE